MTRVLCLGGYGQFGLPTARMLLADPAVDRVTLAGRDLAKAQAAAARLGDGCDAIQVDADDPASLATAMDGVDVVASTLWSAEGRAERVARAATDAGAHYCDLNGDDLGEEVDTAARAAGRAVLTQVGMSPGVVSILPRHLLAAFDAPAVLVSVRHWTHLLDAWADLFDAYVELPGGRTRGPLGRQLYPTLTAPSRDADHVAAVLRDACLVPFWLTMAGHPERWASSVPVLKHGAIVDLDPTEEGIAVALISGDDRRERFLKATDAGPDEEGVRRILGSVTGMTSAFDAAVRDAARRVAEGADAEQEARTLENLIASDLDTYLRPADEIASIPSSQFMVYGNVDEAPSRGTLVVNENLFAPDRFLDITAAAVAVTVRYLLDGTIGAIGTSTMEDVITDVERFAEDYVASLPSMPSGDALFTMRIEPG